MTTYKLSRELVNKWLLEYSAVKKRSLCFEAKIGEIQLSVTRDLSLRTLSKLNPVVLKYGYLDWYNRLANKHLYDGIMFSA